MQWRSGWRGRCLVAPGRHICRAGVGGRRSRPALPLLRGGLRAAIPADGSGDGSRPAVGPGGAARLAAGGCSRGQLGASSRADRRAGPAAAAHTPRRVRWHDESKIRLGLGRWQLRVPSDLKSRVIWVSYSIVPASQVRMMCPVQIHIRFFFCILPNYF